jgi:hypothetical protein
MVFLYLLVRIVAGRIFRYEHMPIAMFPVHMISDMLCEVIMGDFSFTEPIFWIVLVFDLFLLVMRDADLWEGGCCCCSVEKLRSCSLSLDVCSRPCRCR